MPDYVPRLQTPDSLAAQTGQMGMQNALIIPNAVQSALQSIVQGIMQGQQMGMQRQQNSAYTNVLQRMFGERQGEQSPTTPASQQSVQGQPQLMQPAPQAQPTQPTPTGNPFTALGNSPLPLPAHMMSALMAPMLAGNRFQNQMSMQKEKETAAASLVGTKEQAGEKRDVAKAALKPIGTTKSANQQAMDDRQANTRWDKFTVQMDAAKASSRSLIGQAMQNNMRSRRALVGVNDPGMIPQQLDAAVSDYASMMKGGSADIASMDHARFSNFKTKWANLKSEITSKPQAVNTPEVANKLQQMLKDVVSVDDNATKRWVKYHESANADLIKTHKDQWEGMKNELLNLTSGEDAAPAAGQKAAPAAKSKAISDPLGIL